MHKLISKVNYKQIYYSFALCILLSSTYTLYSFGLHSEFFLDDFSNLQSLSNISTFNFKQIALFSLSGNSGPTGRPLSLLTFALQYSDWPNNPYAFKYINLLIHLINTILIFIVSKQLFFFQQKTQAKYIELSLIVATIWAIHPIQVTTVLYSIQRMTELSATFVLLGVVTYLYGRKLLTNRSNNFRTAYLCMSAGLVLGLIFSILSKENGILILLFILVIEETILNSSLYQHPNLKAWKTIFLYLPILVVCCYFIYTFNASIFYKYRDFSLSERLITENAIVLDYLSKIVAPRVSAFSLYYDDFPISHKLTDSFQTLAGFIFIFSSTIFSIIYRKRYPLISFGFLWYYAGHLLESSFISLELYFEHRNYLPLLGIVFVIVSLLYKTLILIKSKTLTIIYQFIIFLLISFLAFITYNQTSLFGDTQQAKLTWALEKPNSKRAQSTAANIMASYGDHKQAIVFLKKIIEITPDDPTPHIQWLQYRCSMKDVPHPNMNRLYHLARNGTANPPSIHALNSIVIDLQEGNCKNLKYTELSHLFKSFENNPKLTNKHVFFQIYAMMEGSQGHYVNALNLANKSLSYKLSVRVAFFQLRWLSLLDDYQAAYKYISRVKEINDATPKTSILFKSDIQEWESFLLKKLSAQNKTLDKPS